MAQNASAFDLGTVFENDPSGYVAGNLDPAGVAWATRKVRRFVRRNADEDAALSRTWGTSDGLDDPALLCSSMGEGSGRVFLTGTDDLEQREVVHVYATGPRSVQVVYPGRDALDEDGDPAAYHYEQDASTLLRRMNADGGWTEVRPFETVENAVNCPECGSFVRVSEDGQGFPGATCPRHDCHGRLDVDDLLDLNAVESVY
jgi:hypothetical protein